MELCARSSLSLAVIVTAGDPTHGGTGLKGATAYHSPNKVLNFSQEHHYCLHRLTPATAAISTRAGLAIVKD